MPVSISAMAEASAMDYGIRHNDEVDITLRI
jgi:hypothetical protein